MTPLLLLLLPCFLLCVVTATSNIPKHHVVYMGSSLSDGNRRDAESAESGYLEMLSSIIPSHQRERTSIIHRYNHAFRGFSAMLTESEASVLSGHDGIVSIFPDSILELHTTRSWDFLQEAAAESGRVSHRARPTTSSDDVIIGMIDTGIWPESPSFNDEGIGAVPSRWKGVCMEGPDFKKSNCNRKLIGARYYNMQMTMIGNQSHLAASKGSPRDFLGHGTHTASTAAGARVPNASYYGLAQGTAKGGLPSARIASYKACSDVGCSGATLLKAIDDAIRDGVDMISISIGMSSLFQPDYLSDPIAIGTFHAEQMGVMVICSGGNDGPDPYTVVNTAPWIFTVAASNIDRDFQSTVVLGNGKTFTGSAINFSNLTRSRTYPLVIGKDAAANFTPVSEARNCYPGSFDPEKVVNKIVVCVADDPTVSRKIKKLVVEDAKAKGLILIDEDEKSVPFDSGVFPFAEVGDIAGFQILNYINSTKNPKATILPTVDIHRYRPAPTVAYFSSRGPAQLTENVLKPDIMAPGVAILAAISPDNKSGSIPHGEKPSKFSIKSGTSMACPHVTGAAAFIKTVHRGWTSSMIKSALMTTATMYNNMKKPLINSTNNYANPHEVGVGEINPIKALNPGLVFETITENYLEFLCYYGYKEKNIRSMSNTKFNCPKISTEELISNINYPSISVSKLNRHKPIMTIKRTATNVGAPNSTYIAKVNAPVGLVVKVLPERIVFAEGVRKVSFQVSFNGKEAPTGYSFGSITWFDGRHSVNTVFGVNVE
ncbi:putative tripeptidyl-peptidase II [Rosa chinensis]|uniref:Putative tripeptidyl-peptidase II n=1 Tax=Rosa chinensis TaxID=74649 RepID=A0A2P6SB66_ROSCH|nr:CO(2)-response secreted protease [Rosa chinensis]PRQ55932.1 putative tripeptidyl-peptidase II [Rosa chinensis]